MKLFFILNHNLNNCLIFLIISNFIKDKLFILKYLNIVLINKQFFNKVFVFVFINFHKINNFYLASFNSKYFIKLNLINYFLNILNLKYYKKT